MNAAKARLAAVSHSLDRPVWNALTTRQASLARGDQRAVRMEPSHGPFGAAADDSEASQAALAALVAQIGVAAMIEAEPSAIPNGVRLVNQAPLLQMVASALISPRPIDLPIVNLCEADAPAMLALATLTEPGPFLASTHRLGDFVGVKADGALAAMAGERMKLTGFTEVSAVCTEPRFRGRGYAPALVSAVTARIQARGEAAFLHVFPHNTPAIAVYEALGFSVRRTMTLTVLARS